MKLLRGLLILLGIFTTLRFAIFYVAQERLKEHVNSVAEARKLLDLCTPDHFSISHLKGVIDHDYIRITGKVKHDCNSANGVALKITAYDQHDDVITSSTIWPDSTSNIPPNTDFPFEYPIRVTSAPKTFEAIPVEARRW